MRRLRHGVGLLLETARFSVTNRVWWPLPAILIVLAVGALMAAAQIAAPFTVYTLF